MPDLLLLTAVKAAAAEGGKRLLQAILEKIRPSLSLTERKAWENRISSCADALGQERALASVPTLLGKGQTVDLRSVFVAPTVRRNGSSVADHKVDCFDDLARDRLTVLRGGAGAGKSFLMRRLALSCLERETAVPVFIDYRKLESRSIVDEALRFFQRNRLPLSEDTFLSLLDAGQVVLILDGFDEVPQEKQWSRAAEIEQLAASPDAGRILASTRPQSTLAKLPHAAQLDLQPLCEDEWEQVARRLYAVPEDAHELIAIVSNPAQADIKEVLTTPLMVGLLVLQHRLTATVPERRWEFYSGLFDGLVNRHDHDLKGGWNRSLRSGVRRHELREFLRMLSLYARQAELAALNADKARNFAEKIVARLGLTAAPDDLLSDCVNAVGLLLRDGNWFEWPHRSVQEFLASKAVEGLPDDRAKRFYQAAITEPRRWRQELEDLSEQDKVRFYEYFLSPGINAYLARGDRWGFLEGAEVFLEFKELDEPNENHHDGVRYWRLVESSVRVPRASLGVVLYLLESEVYELSGIVPDLVEELLGARLDEVSPEILQPTKQQPDGEDDSEHIYTSVGTLLGREDTSGRTRTFRGDVAKLLAEVERRAGERCGEDLGELIAGLDEMRQGLADATAQLRPSGPGATGSDDVPF